DGIPDTQRCLVGSEMCIRDRPAVVAAMVEDPPCIVCGAPESSHDPDCMVAPDEPRTDSDETP
ncbi:MAG: hypothetical protein QUU85_04845, partial [Candidatus Eisenbacteria bacterium]|nr:hypothetical protein [Candidatus Eisenbacteria bacterium]